MRNRPQGESRRPRRRAADHFAGKQNEEPPAGREPKAEAQDGPRQLFALLPKQKRCLTKYHGKMGHYPLLPPVEYQKGTGNAILSVIRAGIVKLRETKTGLTGATTRLVAVSEQAKATNETLKHTGLLFGVFLVAVALVVGGVGFAVMGFIGKSRLTELDEMKAAIRAERVALDELRSKTWELELVNYGDGTRGIVLPKGVRVDRTGTVQDGRSAVVIRP